MAGPLRKELFFAAPLVHVFSLCRVGREKLNYKEWQSAYTFNIQLVDTSELYIHIEGPAIKALLSFKFRVTSNAFCSPNKIIFACLSRVGKRDTQDFIAFKLWGFASKDLFNRDKNNII